VFLDRGDAILDLIVHALNSFAVPETILLKFLANPVSLYADVFKDQSGFPGLLHQVYLRDVGDNEGGGLFFPLSYPLHILGEAGYNSVSSFFFQSCL